jgi:hypothetical protein
MVNKVLRWILAIPAGLLISTATYVGIRYGWTFFNFLLPETIGYIFEIAGRWIGASGAVAGALGASAAVAPSEEYQYVPPVFFALIAGVGFGTQIFDPDGFVRLVEYAICFVGSVVGAIELKKEADERSKILSERMQ